MGNAKALLSKLHPDTACTTNIIVYVTFLSGRCLYLLRTLLTEDSDYGPLAVASTT